MAGENSNFLSSMSVPKLYLNSKNDNIQWKTWLQQFKLYLLAADLHKETEKRKVAIMLHAMGEKCIEIFNSFNTEISDISLSDLIEKFNNYFEPRKNLTMTRHSFFTCKQKDGESVNDFITNLENLSLNCEFGEVRQSLVRDMFIANMNFSHSNIRQRLLLEPDITLEKAVDLAKIIVIAKSNSENIDKTANSESSSIGNVQRIKRHNVSKESWDSSRTRYHERTRSPSQIMDRQQYSGLNEESSRRRFDKRSPSRSSCQRCGQIHRYKCPASNIGPITDLRWQSGGNKTQEDNNIAIHVIPPDGEEDDEFVPTLRVRRKLSTPLSSVPGSMDGFPGQDLLRTSPMRCLSPLDRTKRRFSTMVSSAAAAAVSRRLSATIGWCLATPTQVKPQIVRQGRALCLQYIKTQIRRSPTCPKKQIVLKRLQRMLETECGEEAINNADSGVLAALRALCAALERKRPDAFRHVARQATRAPSTMLRSDTALAELTLALARRITRENITWSKIAAVYCICGALAREAAEAADGEPALELMAAPAAAIADLLHEEPGSWIASHGGWNGLIERLRISERDHRSEKTLRVMVSFFVMACLILLLLRWVLRAHPAYYD